MPVLPIILLFVAIPLLELYVILQVGDLIGVVPTIALLAADSALGAVLLRRQSRSVWGQFNAVMRSGRVPHRELVDGVAVIFGGALLLTPGFITDMAGLLLLVPPTRAVVRRLALRRIGRRLGFAASVAGAGAAARGRADGEPFETTGRERTEPPTRRLEP